MICQKFQRMQMSSDFEARITRSNDHQVEYNYCQQYILYTAILIDCHFQTNILIKKLEFSLVQLSKVYTLGSHSSFKQVIVGQAFKSSREYYLNTSAGRELGVNCVSLVTLHCVTWSLRHCISNSPTIFLEHSCHIHESSLQRCRI